MTLYEILSAFIVIKARYETALHDLGHSDETSAPYLKLADNAIEALATKIRLENPK